VKRTLQVRKDRYFVVAIPEEFIEAMGMQGGEKVQIKLDGMNKLTIVPELRK